MIDDKTLAQWEQSAQVLGITDGQEIIRNARRYLALRENKIAILQVADIGFDADTYRSKHDAAADRLLEGGE